MSRNTTSPGARSNELGRDVIPAARQVRDEVFRRLNAGESSLPEYIAAQQDFNQIAKQYLDTAIRHRRSHGESEHGDREEDLAVIGQGVSRSCQSRLAHPADLTKVQEGLGLFRRARRRPGTQGGVDGTPNFT